MRLMGKKERVIKDRQLEGNGGDKIRRKERRQRTSETERNSLDTNSEGEEKYYRRWK